MGTKTRTLAQLLILVALFSIPTTSTGADDTEKRKAFLAQLRFW